MEKNDFKHPHVSPDLEEQESIINDEMAVCWQKKRRSLVACQDVLIDMDDMAKAIYSKCDEYLHLVDSCLSSTQFNYLAVSALSDGLHELLTDYITNCKIAINNLDYDNNHRK